MSYVSFLDIWMVSAVTVVLVCLSRIFCIFQSHFFLLYLYPKLQVGCLVFVNGCMFEFVLVAICAQKGADMMSGEVICIVMLFQYMLPHISHSICLKFENLT